MAEAIEEAPNLESGANSKELLQWRQNDRAG